MQWTSFDIECVIFVVEIESLRFNWVELSKCNNRQEGIHILQYKIFVFWDVLDEFNYKNTSAIIIFSALKLDLK